LDYLLVISTSTRQYKDGHDTALLIISKKQYTIAYIIPELTKVLYYKHMF